MFELSNYGETTIKLGSKDIDVTTLQKLLKAKGYFDEPVTGTFGMTTKSAVMNFQRAKGIRVDGIVGPETWAALKDISLEMAKREAVEGITGKDRSWFMLPDYINIFGSRIPTIHLMLAVGALAGAIIYTNMKKKDKI